MLAASAAALPALLALAGCRSSAAFTGPDPLAGRPSPAPDVITLQAVIAAEQTIIGLYQAALAGPLGASTRARGLAGLLAQHRQHLGKLQARLVLPAGASAPPSPPPGRAAGVPGQLTIARLRAAERASAADLVLRLVTVQPALAQLLASIAASDATHVTALSR